MGFDAHIQKHTLPPLQNHSMGIQTTNRLLHVMLHIYYIMKLFSVMSFDTHIQAYISSFTARILHHFILFLPNKSYGNPG